jgi:hypothetical protein
MRLVTRYGKLWPRNDHSIEELVKVGRGLTGVYILYDGSMPVYVGKGVIPSRIKGHRRSRTRSKFWDYFSWFEVRDPGLRHEAEALLLKTLPYYLRLLNKQQAGFPRNTKLPLENPEPPEFIKKPKFVKVVWPRKRKKR